MRTFVAPEVSCGEASGLLPEPPLLLLQPMDATAIAIEHTKSERGSLVMATSLYLV
jgi:hypothetical protein